MNDSATTLAVSVHDRGSVLATWFRTEPLIENATDGSLLLLVPEGKFLAGEDRFDEQPGRHVGPAPRSIDREEPQAGDRDAVEMAVAVAHQFAGLLGGGIERNR